MGFLSVLSCAHQWVGDRLRPGDIAVDATVGNGVDTEFLCRAVGPSGTVYGFDIQPQALEQTGRRITERVASPPRLRLCLRSHAEMLEAIPQEHRGRVSAVMFNLGYLPGGDPTVMTRPDSTLSALEAAVTLLKPGGIMTVVVYPGHEGGREEADAVGQWAAAVPEERAQTVVYRFANRRNDPPYLIALEKRNV